MVPLPCGSDGPGPHLDREGLPGALSLLSGGPSSLRAATVTHPCGSRGVSAGRTPSGERGAEPTHPGFPPGKSAPGEPLCPPLPAPCPARGTALPEPSPAVPLFVHMEHVFLLNLKPSLSIVPQRELSHVVPVSGGKGPRPLARSSLPDTQLRNLRTLEAAGPQGAPTPWSLPRLSMGEGPHPGTAATPPLAPGCPALTGPADHSWRLPDAHDLLGTGMSEFP